MDFSQNFKDRPACLDAWHKAFGAPPPRKLSTAFMRRALAFESQCVAEGRLSARTLRRLQAAARDGSAGRSTSLTLNPGTQLLREWNGRTYQVEVTETGIILDGKTYRSLSAIAKKITGAHWSGPRFFGVTS